MAARALGQLRDPRAIPALVATVGASSHGLVLFEENRRALCRIGSSAGEPLVKEAKRRTRRGLPVQSSEAALRVLGDLGIPSVADALFQLSGPQDPATFQLAAAETLLRLGQDDALKNVLSVLKSRKNSITARRRAADILGWYGRANSLDGVVESSCATATPAQEVICWGVALAYCRLAGRAGTAKIDKLIAKRKNKATKHDLHMYRQRFVVVETCDIDVECLKKHLDSKSWRVQERAAIELSRTGDPANALPLAEHLENAHPQVQHAILVGLERLALSGEIPLAALKLLERYDHQKAGGSATPDTLSRGVCLGQRLMRNLKDKKRQSGVKR
jgi:HEAT repeat protein